MVSEAAQRGFRALRYMRRGPARWFSRSKDKNDEVLSRSVTPEPETPVDLDAVDLVFENNQPVVSKQDHKNVWRPLSSESNRPNPPVSQGYVDVGSEGESEDEGSATAEVVFPEEETTTHAWPIARHPNNNPAWDDGIQPYGLVLSEETKDLVQLVVERILKLPNDSMDLASLAEKIDLEQIKAQLLKQTDSDSVVYKGEYIYRAINASVPDTGVSENNTYVVHPHMHNNGVVDFNLPEGKYSLNDGKTHLIPYDTNGKGDWVLLAVNGQNIVCIDPSGAKRERDGIVKLLQHQVFPGEDFQGIDFVQSTFELTDKSGQTGPFVTYLASQIVQGELSLELSSGESDKQRAFNRNMLGVEDLKQIVRRRAQLERVTDSFARGHLQASSRVDVDNVVKTQVSRDIAMLTEYFREHNIVNSRVLPQRVPSPEIARTATPPPVSRVKKSRSISWQDKEAENLFPMMGPLTGLERNDNMLSEEPAVDGQHTLQPLEDAASGPSPTQGGANYDTSRQRAEAEQVIALATQAIDNESKRNQEDAAYDAGMVLQASGDDDYRSTDHNDSSKHGVVDDIRILNVSDPEEGSQRNGPPVPSVAPLPGGDEHAQNHTSVLGSPSESGSAERPALNDDDLLNLSMAQHDAANTVQANSPAAAREQHSTNGGQSLGSSAQADFSHLFISHIEFKELSDKTLQEELVNKQNTYIANEIKLAENQERKYTLVGRPLEQQQDGSRVYTFCRPGGVDDDLDDCIVRTVHKNGEVTSIIGNNIENTKFFTPGNERGGKQCGGNVVAITSKSLTGQDILGVGDYKKCNIGRNGEDQQPQRLKQASVSVRQALEEEPTTRLGETVPMLLPEANLLSSSVVLSC